MGNIPDHSWWENESLQMEFPKCISNFGLKGAQKNIAILEFGTGDQFF